MHFVVKGTSLLTTFPRPRNPWNIPGLWENRSGLTGWSRGSRNGGGLEQDSVFGTTIDTYVLVPEPRPHFKRDLDVDLTVGRPLSELY